MIFSMILIPLSCDFTSWFTLKKLKILYTKKKHFMNFILKLENLKGLQNDKTSKFLLANQLYFFKIRFVFTIKILFLLLNKIYI